MITIAGRKPLNKHERELKIQFDNCIREYSLDALKEIVKLSKHCMDSKVRLQASCYLVDKFCGKTFCLVKPEEQQQVDQNITINLIQTESKIITEQEQRAIEHKIEMIESGQYEEENTDEWGTDVYFP